MKKTEVRVHNDIPWLKIEKMWNEGKSYEFMAKATNRFNPKSDDPTKPLRAIVSRGLNVGFADPVSGKLRTLKPRAGMRLIGAGLKAPKVKAAKATAAVKTTGKVGRKPVYGKSILINLDESGKYLRVEADKPKSLVAFTKIMPSLVDVLHQKGYDVVEKAVTATAVDTVEPTAPVPAPETETMPTVEHIPTPTVDVSASNAA